MAIVRYSPLHSLIPRLVFHRPLGLLEEMERFVDEVWGSWPTRVVWSSLHPAIDLFEEEKELVLRVELPGVKKEDIDISIQDSVLSLKAEKKAEETKGSYYMCERTFGTWHRTVELPLSVEADKVSATFEGGVLEIRLPQAEEAKTKDVKVSVK